MNAIRKAALKNAVLTTLYIAAVGCFMYYGASIKIGRSNTILVPITLLMLFVMSASITGYLIFGKPVQVYLDGKKKEAMSLLMQTLVFFSIITFSAIILLVTLTR